MTSIDTNFNLLLKRIKLAINFKWADFEDAYKTFYANDVNDNKDKICLLIHLIMMQQNFSYYDPKSKKNTNHEINQIKSDLYNKITYNSISSNTDLIHLNSNILITILKSGNNVDIHLKFKNYNTKFLSVKLNEMFQMQSNAEIKDKSFDKFQLDFKDSILNPFKHYLRLNEDIFLINGLIDLPYEIIFKLCTNYLNIKSILCLASSCCYLNKILFSNLTKSDSIWNKLIYRDFKVKLTLNDATLLNNNYLKEYKKYYRKRKYSYNMLII